MRAECLELHERGAGRDEQEDRVLHRIDLPDEALAIHPVDHLDVVVDPGPRREGDQRRSKENSGAPNQVERLERVVRRVALT